MDILPFSLFNVNFKEYQMKSFYSLIEYVIHRDLSDVFKFSWNKEETLWFFFDLIERQVSGHNSISVRSLTLTIMLIY